MDIQNSVKSDNPLYNGLANDYSKYFVIDTSTEKAALNQELEGMLTQMDEYGAMLDRTSCENKHLLEENVPQIYSHYQAVQRSFQSIDHLEALVMRIKADLTNLEATMTKAESDLQINNPITNVMKPFFFVKKIPTSPLPERTYKRPDIFKMEDYFSNTSSDNSNISIQSLQINPSND